MHEKDAIGTEQHVTL